MKRKNIWIKLILLLLLLFLVAIIGISLGAADLSVADSFRIVLSKLPGIGNLLPETEMGSQYEIIIWKLRMPRICLAALCGAALAVSGTAYQGVFQNPLADPYILGVSSGAALAATITTVAGLGVSFVGLGPVGVAGFIGATLTVFAVYVISRTGGKISMTNMLLTGTAVSTMFSAVISLILIFNHEEIAKIYLWTMGSFSGATWGKVLFMFIFTIVCITLLIILSPKLNILMLGEEDAKSLGTDTKKYRIIIISIASLLVAASVAVSGIIGFVGLIIPHSVRMTEGSDNRAVAPISAIAGAIFMCLCDTVARTVASPTEIPIGIITAICGAPYFIFLIIAGKKKAKRS